MVNARGVLRSQYASRVVAIGQGTTGTWNAELKVNGMGSMDGKPITVCESVLLSRSLTLRGKTSVAVWLKLVAPPADLLHRGIMDNEATRHS